MVRESSPWATWCGLLLDWVQTELVCSGKLVPIVPALERVCPPMHSCTADTFGHSRMILCAFCVFRRSAWHDASPWGVDAVDVDVLTSPLFGSPTRNPRLC